ncbi:acetylcholinesterase-like [Branchiostoma floridae x Branchiostoma japonicum]
MALESIETGEYTCQSDVWSFGVLLWEIATLGKDPCYDGRMQLSFLQMVGILRQGIRLERPPGCPEDLYRLMRSCWRDVPDTRPTPEGIEERLLQLRPQPVNVYQYEFQYRSSVFWFKPPYVQADHADEIMFVLGAPLVLIIPGVDLFTEEERKLSLDMMAYWANFARTGDPSDSAGAPTARPLVTWPRYTPDTPAYLQLRPEPAVGTALLKPEKLKFWNEVVPRYLAGDTASPAARVSGSYFYLVLGVAMCVGFFAIPF